MVLPDKFNILACDPGKTNFAWAIMECGQNHPYRILATGQFSPTITNAQRPEEQAKGFRAAVLRTIGPFDIYYACIERFMVRGAYASLNHEIINLSIGFLYAILVDKGITTYMTPAGVWKNHFARHYGNNVAEEIFPIYDTALTEHQGDACCIAVWCADVDLKRRGLSDLVLKWPEKKCNNCTWDYKTDCKRTSIVPTQCKYFQGPCSTCRFDKDTNPKCIKWVRKNKRESCALWKPKLAP